MIPKPSCWIVAIDGVGAIGVTEELSRFFVFHKVSTVFRMAIGHGCVVDFVSYGNLL